LAVIALKHYNNISNITRASVEVPMKRKKPNLVISLLKLAIFSPYLSNNPAVHYKSYMNN